jgi:predicted transcriptional regulator
MPRKILMLSIRPHYAKKIFERSKTVELRRVCPKIEGNDIVILYVTAPVKALVGAFKVDRIIRKAPKDLWEVVSDGAAVTREEYDEYYAGKTLAVAIFFTEVWKLPKPVGLHELQKKLPRFHPPRTHIYFKNRGNGDGFPFRLYTPDTTGMTSLRMKKGQRMKSI